MTAIPRVLTTWNIILLIRIYAGCRGLTFRSQPKESGSEPLNDARDHEA